MTRTEAISAILALPNAGAMSTKTWEAMGWPFEAFLRFVQIPEPRASENLSALQGKMREAHPLLALAAEGEEEEENEWVDQCDQCCSTDVAYPYTTQGYLCTNCRSVFAGRFKNIN